MRSRRTHAPGRWIAHRSSAEALPDGGPSVARGDARRRHWGFTEVPYEACFTPQAEQASRNDRDPVAGSARRPNAVSGNRAVRWLSDCPYNGARDLMHATGINAPTVAFLFSQFIVYGNNSLKVQQGGAFGSN